MARGSDGRNNTDEDAALLDLESTLHRLGGDRSLLACLADVFSEDAPVLMERLTSAVKSMNGEEIRSAAHALRGLAANFGAAALTQPLRQLEEIGVRNDLERAQNLLAEVDEKTARLQSTLKKHR